MNSVILHCFLKVFVLGKFGASYFETTAASNTAFSAMGSLLSSAASSSRESPLDEMMRPWGYI